MHTFAISAGDPLGVGPEVTIAALKDVLSDAAHRADRYVVFGDAAQLSSLCASLRLDAVCSGGKAFSHDRGASIRVSLVDVGALDASAFSKRQPQPEAGVLQLAALNAATRHVMSGHAQGLITAPMSKEAVSMTGEVFLGHTEHLAQAAGLKKDDVTMLFVGPRLVVALVTTHLPLNQVSKNITIERVERSMRHLAEVVSRCNHTQPRARPSYTLAVAGLNPHAGEGGLLGSEERDVLQPAIDMLRGSNHQSNIIWHGPVPAESAFRLASQGDYHGVVAMYHDQATIASKLLDWEHAVNVTWGLPFVRTSVDHGVAYDIAGRGVASAQGMRAAIKLAQELVSDD